MTVIATENLVTYIVELLEVLSNHFSANCGVRLSNVKSRRINFCHFQPAKALRECTLGLALSWGLSTGDMLGKSWEKQPHLEVILVQRFSMVFWVFYTTN